MLLLLTFVNRKIPRDLTEASLSGAGLSILAALAMMFLFGMVSCFIIVRLDYRIEHNTIRYFTALVFNFHFDICLAIVVSGT